MNSVTTAPVGRSAQAGGAAVDKWKQTLKARDDQDSTCAVRLFSQLDAATADHCGGCGTAARLGCQFDYAFQPIVEVANRSLFAHEALVRGPAGEGALSVLSQVTEHNRYRFDQACRVKAIKTAAQLGLKERLSINFLPNAVYKPEVCDFTPDIIKLDMALVRTVDTNKSRQAIARGMVRICQELGIQVIAEGIETAAERDFFLSEGVTLMQGFLFAKPAFRSVTPTASVAWPGSPRR